ncbi:hypothetical protein BVY02_00305 [bacterium J17]|nr:hypothetical protein BVY02_00305 [bacterium J17]
MTTNNNIAVNSSVPFAVRLEFFEGPMDLLLHLVRQQEVDIEHVEMSTIAEQYLQIISQAKHLDLEQATEFLVIAATLTAIKSQSLLPASGELGDELGEDELDEGFYEELRRRLQIYEVTKMRAKALRELPQQGIDTFTRVDRSHPRGSTEIEVDESDIHSVTSAFSRLLKRVGATVNSLRIRLEPVSVVSCMMNIVDSLQSSSAEKKPKTFLELVKNILPFSSSEPENSKEAVSRPVHVKSTVIGGFIAMLELLKRGLMTASQSGDDAKIEISLAMSGPDGKDGRGELDLSKVEFESEFDKKEAVNAA